MDFSKWAVVCYKDDTGLGREASSLSAILDLGYYLVAPSNKLLSKALSGPKEISLSPDCPPDILRSYLEKLEGIIYLECNRWHPQLLIMAKELNIKTVCVPNWEWFDGKNKEWQLCDLIVSPCQITKKVVNRFGWQNTVVIPAAIELSKFPARSITGKAKHFVHNAGLVNEDDRKGTRDTIRAFTSLKRSDIRLTVRLQKEVDLPPFDERVKLIVDNLSDPAQLYAEGDVAIQPSKLEGIGYMIIEPLCIGMPVITLDYPPMNEYIRSKELLVRKKWFKRKAFPSHWVKHAHLRLPDIADLAKKISWCADNDMTKIAQENRIFAEKMFNAESLKKRWFEALSSL